ncbi:MAG: hypothetical protein ACXWBP_05720, partial [Limisphaerales bacterium]
MKTRVSFTVLASGAVALLLAATSASKADNNTSKQAGPPAAPAPLAAPAAPSIPTPETAPPSQAETVPTPQTAPTPQVVPSPQAAPYPQAAPTPETAQSPDASQAIPGPESTPAPSTLPAPQAQAPEAMPDLPANPVRNGRPQPVMPKDLSPGTTHVIQLFRKGVNGEALLHYVNNSHLDFGMNLASVNYLEDIGVPTEVV